MTDNLCFLRLTVASSYSYLLFGDYNKFSILYLDWKKSHVRAVQVLT
jgi:hypothetical protein